MKFLQFYYVVSSLCIEIKYCEVEVLQYSICLLIIIWTLRNKYKSWLNTILKLEVGCSISDFKRDTWVLILYLWFLVKTVFFLFNIKNIFNVSWL